jgi:RNA polymerase-binding transcription factor
MTQADVPSYRRRLLDLAGRLGDEVSHLREAALGSPGAEADGEPPDPDAVREDAPHHDGEEERTLGVLGNEAHILGEVNAALERIGLGTFGRCEACGQPVARRRLRALPYARHCIACAKRPRANLTG